MPKARPLPAAPTTAPRAAPDPIADPFPDLAVSPEAAERLRTILARDLGIAASPEEALRAGTFLVLAAVLLARPRPEARPSPPPRAMIDEPGAPAPAAPLTRVA